MLKHLLDHRSAPPEPPKESTMSKLRVHNFAISLDGYGAGPDQSVGDPLGVGGERLHEWAFITRSFQVQHGSTDPDGETSLDDDFIARGVEGIGATMMGRNMFGPIRGPWSGTDWRGWWGDDPPFHHPVFVLTHYPHDPIPMEGGTTFHFVTGGIEDALAQAVDAAGGKDVRLGGGVSTIQQCLRAGLLDDLHVAIVPTLLGGGERLFEHLDDAVDGYECVELASSARVAHVRLVRSGR
jgi:dihydrofolate reductase